MEDNGEVDGDGEGEKMDGTVDDAEEESGEDDFVIIRVIVEKSLPAARGSTGFGVLSTGHDGSKDEEWYEACIDNGGEEHIAARRCWGSASRRSGKVVDCVDGMYYCNTWLKRQSSAQRLLLRCGGIPVLVS